MSHTPHGTEAPRSAERTRALLAGVFGEAPTLGEPVAKTLTGLGRRDWEDEVAPLIARHWPEVPAATRQRLQALACEVHAAHGALALLVSSGRPAMLTAPTLLGRLPAARAVDYARAARPALGLLRRTTLRDECRRMTLGAALSALLDEALGRGSDGVEPSACAERLPKLLDLSWRPERGVLRVVRELLIKQESGLDRGDRNRFEAVAGAFRRWAEVACDAAAGRAVTEAAVTATVAALAFPLDQHLDDDARRWLTSAVSFVLVTEDWVAQGHDGAGGAGHWTIIDVDQRWQASRAQLARAGAAAGFGASAGLAFLDATESNLARIASEILATAAV